MGDYAYQLGMIEHWLNALRCLESVGATAEDKRGALDVIIRSAERAKMLAEDSMLKAPPHLKAGGAARRRWRDEKRREISDILEGGKT